MKKNLLPSMQKITMSDKDGDEFVMEVEARESGGLTYVFLSDTHQPGASRLAQDAIRYLQKISDHLELDNGKTVFCRHIYQEQMGSSFGIFEVEWESEAEPSYRFRLLTDFDDLQDITRVIENGEPVRLEETGATV